MISLQILLVLFLVGLSLFLATVEAAFNLLKRRRLTQVGFHDERRIERAQGYLDDPPRLLMPAHFGTYTAHIGMTVIITSISVMPAWERLNCRSLCRRTTGSAVAAASHRSQIRCRHPCPASPSRPGRA